MVKVAFLFHFFIEIFCCFPILFVVVCSFSLFFFEFRLLIIFLLVLASEFHLEIRVFCLAIVIEQQNMILYIWTLLVFILFSEGLLDFEELIFF